MAAPSSFNFDFLEEKTDIKVIATTVVCLTVLESKSNSYFYLIS